MGSIPPRSALLPLLASLKAQLAAIHPDVESDEQLLTDVLDGQTDSLDVLREIVRSAIHHETLAEALNARISTMRARRDRLEAHGAACRNVVRAGLAELGLRKLEDSEFTAVLRDGPPKVVISDLEELPDAYKRVKIEPALTAIGRDLKAGEQVPGAALAFSNTPVLAISRA
jgi:hypothetical protein